MGGTRNNKGRRNPMYGKCHSEEAKERMRKPHKKFSEEGKVNVSKAQRKRVAGNSYVNGFQGKHHNEEWKEENRRRMMGNQHSLGQIHTKERRRRMIRGLKKLWQDPAYVEKHLRILFASMHLRPTKPERRLRNRLSHLFPGEYKYVGDGNTFIGRKCPDFININGQKEVIEMFGDYWHSKKVTGRTKRQEENQRIKCFAKYGFKTLIVWESELKNISKLKSKLLRFHSR